MMRDQKDLIWQVGRMRGGWGNPGPIWSDYRELMSDPLPGVNQVFGHTAMSSIIIQWKKGNFYACVDTHAEIPPALTLIL